MADKKTPVLQIDSLTVDFDLGKTCHAVRDTSVRVEPGEMVALVGESGCGKTMTALSAIGLQPQNAKIPQGKILFDGSELRGLNEEQWNQYRGRNIAMIFQEPMTALNPLMKVGRQIAENARIHGASKEEAKAKALEVMKQVGLPDVERLYHEYPHRLSGGMRQRVMIAMALVNQPELLIADEPTTALDVTIQAQILELMQSLQKKLGMAIIMVTHDLGVIAEMCDEIVVMYGGRFCERGTADEIFYNPRHEYTRGLLRSIPNITNMKERLVPISGTPINMLNMPKGCAFCARCDKAMKICLEQVPEERIINEYHRASCWINTRDNIGTVEEAE